MIPSPNASSPTPKSAAITAAKPISRTFVFLVFLSLIAMIATFSYLSYTTYQKDIYLSTTPVTLTNHDIQLGDLYTAKVPKNPAKGKGKNPDKDKPAKKDDAKGKEAPGPKGNADKDTDPLKEMTCQLQLPLGFDPPVYLTPKEETEIYVVHAFTLTSTKNPATRFVVSEIDMDPLNFQAASRDLRLSALHDIQNSHILEEGPTTINGAPAYTLIIEGDENNIHIKSRHIIIQGPSSIVYTIKATAPAPDWPAAGQNFDASILTFKIPTPPTPAP